MTRILEIVVLGPLVAGFVLWVLIRSLRKSSEPAALVGKWIVTAIIISIYSLKLMPAAGSGNVTAVGAIIYTAALAVILGLVWATSIGAILVKPLTSLYDGGDAEIEPQPFYSIAVAKRKKGLYSESLAEIQKQLEKFPNDFAGQYMIAEIQAENLNDLPAAEITIKRICAQPDHAPRNIALALNTLADWHLKYSLDLDAARESLQSLAARYPESEFAAVATQRLAHLSSKDDFMAAHDRKKYSATPGPQNLGLLQSAKEIAPSDLPAAQLAAEYVRHLQTHPLDYEVREKLASLYAEHYQRPDLAQDQLEQLIASPIPSQRNVVRWLNLLADLQVHHGGTYDAAWQTLGRIIEMFPTSPAAELARNRMDLLKLEMKAKEKSQTVKLGSYEQNLGLKGKSLRQP